jgi:rRNA maturation RNase YbeY
MTRRTTEACIDIATNHPSLRFPYQETIRTLRYVYTGEKAKPCPLSVVFTHDRYIKKINTEFLGHTYETDILTFPLGPDEGAAAELYINLDAARRQAATYGVSMFNETQRLLIHGALHLLGYDDTTQQKQEAMHQCENTYLQKLK